VAEPPPATVGLGESCVAVGAAASPPPRICRGTSIAQVPRRPALQDASVRCGRRHDGRATRACGALTS
jgi:hypothetical protein